MVRLRTYLLALVIAAAAFTGATVADSPSQGDSVVAVDATDLVASTADGGGENSTEENGTDDPLPAEFVITDVETNTPITVGETIEVTATVDNIGEEAGTGNVWFDLGEYRKGDTSVSLEPGESRSVSLSYVSKSGDADDWSMTVGTPDDTATRTVTIDERDDERDDETEDTSSDDGSGSGSSGFTGSASFDATSLNVTQSATVGDVVHLQATVENTGTAGGEKLVWFTADGSTVNETAVELDRGTQQTVTYAYNTSELENGTHELAVETPDSTETRELVLEPRRSNLLVDSIDTNSTVDAGEHVEASFGLHNAGNATANTTVTLLLNDLRTDAEAVSVAPNASTTVQLTYRTNTDLTGDLDFAVDAEDSRESFSVNVTEPTPEQIEVPELTEMSEQNNETTDVPNSTADDAGTSTPREDDAAGTTDAVPGFGVVPMLAALLLALVAVIARRRGD